MTATSPADFHKRKKPYWLIPILAVLLVVIGAAAPANQMVLGLVWGTVFSVFALFLVMLMNESGKEEPSR